MASGYRDDMANYKLKYVRNHPLFPNKPRQTQEHRLIMAEHLGRPLLRSEIVHHKDEDDTNNYIDNLELMSSQSLHASLHHLGKSSPLKGTHISAETRRKISLGHIGKHHTIETKMKMAMIRKDYWLQRKFPGI